MSNFPNDFDDDTTLPIVNDNISEVGGDAINALRDVAVAIEQNIGLGAAGTTPSIANRLSVCLNPDGTIKPSVITSLGLVTLPIRENQIASDAAIPESKLRLDHRTQDLFNYIRDLSGDVNLAIGWISKTGVKLEPHLLGAIYRHTMDQIDVSVNDSDFLNNRLRVLRDNSNSYKLVASINAELLAHEWADGSPLGTGQIITTNNGSVISVDYAHPGSGIFINTSRFNNIPQDKDNVQLLSEYLDDQSIFVLGTRIQNLYSTGISRISRASGLPTDGYGQNIVPVTPAVAFLKHIGNSSSPFDDIDTGDDIIEFKPSNAQQTSNSFDAKFAAVKVGDIVRINYGTIEVPYLIKEKKYSGTIGAKKYLVRIAGKNQIYTTNAVARIDRPLFNNNKYGELSVSPVNNQFGGIPSLVVNNPRGAEAFGLGFNPEQFDEKHYLLYLALYPTGFAQDGYVILPGIDVTGNQGKTPGLYTLESIVQSTNDAFRALGYNYRFTAFSNQGEFGVCLADSYNNAAFSILNVALKSDGTIDTLATQIAFPNNVVDLIPTVGTTAPDPLGIGPSGSGVSSPPFYATYGSSTASQSPTKLFVPLRRKTFYVNGTEKERLAREDSQALDGYGDGYWVATIQDVQTPSGRVQTTYRIALDLSTSGLKAGKTIVVQSLGSGSLVDFGRFVIESVTFGCSPDVFTDITVYDSVHATGFSPASTLQPFAHVAVYFGADSVSFNAESATDYSVISPFKRHFEVYVDDQGKTFTHERGRINISGSTQTVNGVALYGYTQLSKLDIVKISPKLRGYQFGTVNKITLRVFNYSSSTGTFDGYLANYDGTYFTHTGPHITGKKGQVTRFYDETNTDYIDIVFDANANISDFTDQVIDFQLFPTLQLDDEIMLLATCQVNDTTKYVNKVVDARQFGNISEKDLSSSVFDYMSIPEKHLHTNGIIRGFDIYSTFNGAYATIDLQGGLALVNGKIFNINNDTVTIPAVKELYNSSLYNVEWALCINDNGEWESVPLLDYDVNLGNPAGYVRMFNARDIVSGNTYIIPGLTFSELVNNTPRLTLIYLVSAVVTGTSASPNVAITVKDARKFTYKKDWGQIPTLTSGLNLGDFRSFESLTSWFNFNSSFNNTVNVKGTFNTFPTNLAWANRASFRGDGTAAFNINTVLNAANVDFDNISFAVNNAMSYSNVSFNNIVFAGSSGNCTFYGGSVLRDSTLQINGVFNFSNVELINVTFNFNASTNISFTNCKINDCTFNFNSAVNMTFLGTLIKDNAFNFNTGSNTVNLTGIVLGNTFTWASSSAGAISVTGNIDISDNKFIANNSTLSSTFLNIADGTSGVIVANQFFRNTNTLTGYITAPVTVTSGTVSIADNFFDSPTIDGSNQNLIKNLSIAWKYVNNLNTPPTLVVRRITAGGTYTVAPTDYVLALEHTSALTINLPAISLSPPGRTLIIKDVNGVADSYPITLKRGSTGELLENLSTDLTYKNPYGTITLVISNTGWIII